MTGKRGARAAAVLMAGLVGTAVLAPGMAAAQDLPDIPVVPSLIDGATPPASDPGTSTTTTPAETTTTTTSPAPLLPTVPPLSGVLPGTPASTGTDAGTSGSQESTTGGEGESSAARVASAGTPASLTAATDELQKALLVEGEDGATPTPLAGLLNPAQLEAFFPDGVPTEAPDGGFSNPQQACAFFGSQLTASDPSGTLNEGFNTFCAGLPTEFGADGLSGLTDLLDSLAGLLTGLAPMDNTGSIEEFVPASYNNPEYAAFHTGSGANLYNCGDLDQETAQALLASDPTDPNNLDADFDGFACEDSVSHASYEGFPQGGVATGDSSSALDAAQAGSVAVALVMTAGFAAAGGARRRDAADEVAGV